VGAAPKQRPVPKRPRKRPKRAYVVVDVTPADTAEGAAAVESWLTETPSR
jgi:hypothetical protein